MEGELWKKSEHWRRWNQRWFRLEGNQLVWYGKREDDKVKGQITITPGVIIATQEQKTDNTQRWPFTVTFNSPKYILSLCAGSKSSRSEWIKVVQFPVLVHFLNGWTNDLTCLLERHASAVHFFFSHVDFVANT